MERKHEQARRRTGERRATPSRAARLAVALATAALLAAPGAAAAPRNVADGIEFSYYAPGAGKVVLAGDFNGWNANDAALRDDGKGNWTIVVKLGPGKHRYKFVVDGGWLADPENPSSEPDPYGGANSVVTIGDDGKIVETTPARPLSNTPLNARVFVGGHYLTRLNWQKNVDGDPRFRLQRPLQQVDLNFNTTVSDVVDAYTRLRLDNTQNVEQNDIAADMDETSLDLHPGPVHVVGYRNRELLQLDDPLSSGGDRDLPGTILDDHLRRGKGTTGVTLVSHPLGLTLQGHFADVYDADYEGDPDLYDDTGRDLIALRLSRGAVGCDFGLPVVFERTLNWFELNKLIGGPVPALDAFRSRTGDASEWYEHENRSYQVGLDATRKLCGGRVTASLEFLYGGFTQEIVTGNKSSISLDNGTIEVPLMSRLERTFHGSVDANLGGTSRVSVEHTSRWQSGAEQGEVSFSPTFKPFSTANKQVYFTVDHSPAEVATDYTEATWTWKAKKREHLVWLQRIAADADYAAVGARAPHDSTSGHAKSVTWVLSGRHSLGSIDGRWGRWELESAFSFANDDVTGMVGQVWEFILRGERRVARDLSVLADVRLIDYDVIAALGADQAAGERAVNTSYVNPFGGLRYAPNPRVNVVLAYGLDPLAFDIDYQGRQIGRWSYRNRYQYENAASPFAAEKALADLRLFGLRAQFTF